MNDSQKLSRISQQTLDGVFTTIRDFDKKVKANDLLKNNNIHVLEKIPTSIKKISGNLNQIIDEISNEVYSSDDEIIKSSQVNNEFKLKKCMKKNSSIKSKILTTPQKNILLDSSKQTPSISNICDIDSVIVKEESIELNENIPDPIKITQDLSKTIFRTKLLSNVLDYSSPIYTNIIATNSIMEQNNESKDEHVIDSLCFEEKCNDDNEISTTNNIKRKVFIDKSNSKSFNNTSQKLLAINKSDRLPISPSCNNSSVNKNNKKKLKQIKDELFPKKLIQKLKSLKIKLKHEVPPQHKIKKNTGFKALNEKQLIEFESYGPLKRGPFTKSEDKIIKQNWKNFCKIHNWNKTNVKPFLYLKHNGKYYLNLEERKKFVQFLANGLPWRSLFSVYYRFKNLVNNDVNVGKYTDKQDKVIIKYMIKESNSQLKKSYTEVAKILNRTNQSVYYRFTRLKKIYNAIEKKDNTFKNDITKYQKPKISKPKQKIFTNITDKIEHTVTWTYPVVNKFIQTLTEISSCKLEKLKNVIINQNIWYRMEKNINIDHKILKKFWYLQLHMQIFCPLPIYLNDLKIKLIQYMYDKDIRTLEDITWKNICFHFDGISSIFLMKLFKKLVQYAETKIDSSEIKDIVKYLRYEYITKLEEKTIDIILPKLYYRNNLIINVNKGTEKKIPIKITTNPFSDEDI